MILRKSEIPSNTENRKKKKKKKKKICYTLMRDNYPKLSNMPPPSPPTHTPHRMFHCFKRIIPVKLPISLLPGDHAETDDCCRSHDLCKPIIKAFQTRYYFANPSVVPISHCGCDMRFYNCLRRVNTQASNMIGKIFFNIAKMKCFDFDMRKVCTSSLLGICFKYESKCVAILKNNKVYPTV